MFIVANKDNADDEKYKRFVKALQEATKYLKENPKKSWDAFVSYKPKELNNELNTRAWSDTLPYLAKNPATFNKDVYNQMALFMKKNKLIKTLPNLDEYAQEIIK